jgi:hypothetical protein
MIKAAYDLNKSSGDPISTAQLYIDTPAEGTIIENTSNALLAKITRAKSLARGGHPDLRKECGIQLRDAGERFCKEMLVIARRHNGETAASLTDYDEKPSTVWPRAWSRFLTTIRPILASLMSSKKP